CSSSGASCSPSAAPGSGAPIRRRRRGEASSRASPQEPPHEISLGEVATGPHPPEEIAPRERACDGGVAPAAAVQVVDPPAQVDHEGELVAQPRRALLQAPAVLAKHHPPL